MCIYNANTLILTMLKDSIKTDTDKAVYRYLNMLYKTKDYLRIEGGDLGNKFENMMVNSGYIKYLDITIYADKYNNDNVIYLVFLNDLGRKEWDNLENLLKLKGLFK